MRIFDLDGPLFTAMSTLTNIVIVNVLFCICCLPIVTIGAASTALHECMQALLEEKNEKGLVRRFFRSFSKKFGRSTIIWLICLIFIGVLYLYQMAINTMTGNMGQSYQIVFFILCFFFLVGFQYFFPLQARYDKSVGFTLKYSWIVGVLALPWTLLSIVVTGILVYVSFFMNPANWGMMIYLWLVAGFGIVAYINEIFFIKAFHKVWPQEAE